MESLNKVSQERGGRSSFLTEDSVGEESVLRAKMEQESYETEAKYPDTCELVREMLKTIDWNVLQTIFSEYLQKSEVSIGRLNTDSAIYFNASLDENNASMTYTPTGNAVRINLPHLDRLLGNPDISFSHTYHLFITDLVHEFSHVFSHIRHERVIGFGPSGLVHSDTISAGGLQGVGIIRGIKSHKVFIRHTWNTLFMEGVTELVSHEVFEEYIRRHPVDVNSALHDPRPGMARRMVQDNITPERAPYSVAQRFVVALTDAIAEYANVPRDVVWRSLERQYFSGELKPLEFTDQFNEIFGQGFAEKLAKADDALAITNLTLRFKEISAKYPDAVDTWIRHLDLTRGAH